MSVKRPRGDAIPVAKVVNVAPFAPIVAGSLYACWCNLKPAWYVAQSGDSVASVVAGLVEATTTAAATIAEFAEFSAAASADGNTLVLTAATPGVPFDVAVTCSANITVVETTAGGGGQNEVHKITLIGSYTGGTFTVTYDFGAGNVTSGAIAYNAAASAVQTAIAAMSGVGTGNVLVTGGPGPASAWFVTFTGSLSGTSIAAGTVDGTNLTGGATVTIEETTAGNGLSDAIQFIDLSGCTQPMTFTYTLTLDGQTTSALNPGDTAATVQAALQALPNIGSGNCLVYGKEGPFVHFTGTLAGTSVSLLTVGNFTGAGSAPVASTLQAGGQTSSDDMQFIAFGAASDTYKVTYAGQTTALLNTTDAAAGTTLQNALQSLAAIGSGNVTCVAEFRATPYFAGGIFVHFTGSLANTRMQSLTVTETNVAATVTRLSTGHANTNEVQTIAVSATGGTFTLTAGAETTSAIAWNASAATVKTRIETDLSATFTTVTVTGSGTNAAPFVVTVTSPADTAIALLTADPASLTGGAGTMTELTTGHAGTNEVQTLTAAAGVSAGTFTLTFGGLTTEPLPWDASAAAVQAALRTLSTINTVTVSGSAGGPWTVTWSGAQAGTSEPLLGADGSWLTGMTPLITQSTSTWSAGPLHWDDPTNWSLSGIPNSLDQVIFDVGSSDCLYGLGQLAIVTADATADTLTWALGAGGPAGNGASVGNFRADQTVIVTSTGTLPAGISAATPYYLVNVNRDAGTCQLSTTLGGTALNITDAGSGTHTLGCRLTSLEFSARWSGALGLARENGSYLEYRNRYLHIGLATVAAGGAETVTIGSDQGSGAGKLQIDNDVDQAIWKVIQSGGSVDQDARAVLLKGTHAANALEQIQGDVAVALFDGETAALTSIKLRGGTLELGPGVTANGVDRTGGTLIADGCTINGIVTL